MSNLLVIVGPTASGKTNLAIELAQQHNGEVVSADSRQIYRGMDTGTGKDQEEYEKAGVPVHLIDIAEPNEKFSLATWQKMAYNKIDDIIARGKQPILVGGTMLYTDSIIYNYNIPEVEPNENLRQKLEQKKAEELFADLLKKDPAAKEFVEPHNKRRIIRALEVMQATGQKFSELRKKRPAKYDLEIIGIFPGWDVLKEKISARVKKMLDEGLVEEKKELTEKFGVGLSLLQTINYKQALDLIDKKTSEEETLAQMRTANLQYAKKQMYWWKNRSDIKWFSDKEKAALHVVAKLLG